MGVWSRLPACERAAFVYRNIGRKLSEGIFVGHCTSDVTLAPVYLVASKKKRRKRAKMKRFFHHVLCPSEAKTKNKTIKKLGFALVTVCLTLLCGCGANELENSAFPLVMGISAGQTKRFWVSMAYPDLQDADAKENAISTDAFWQGEVSDLFSAVDEMSESSSKNVDLNQLKILILDRKVLESEEDWELLVSFFQENREAAWNVYVMLCDGTMEQIFSPDGKQKICLGFYLEDLLEEWTDIRSEGRTTVGDLMRQDVYPDELELIPVVCIQEDLPVVKNFGVVTEKSWKTDLDWDQGMKTLLLLNQLKEYSFSMEDGTRITLNYIRADRKNIQKQEKNTDAFQQITIKAKADIQTLSGINQEEKKEIAKQAEQSLAQSLSELANTDGILEEGVSYRVDCAFTVSE
jgi:hypothetical protein